MVPVCSQSTIPNLGWTRMNRRRFGRLSLLPLLNGVLLGSIVGALMAYIAAQHNPQGEFYDPDSPSLVLQSIVLGGLRRFHHRDADASSMALALR